METELESLEERRFEKPHNFRLLTISLRNLADNAESNNRYEEASNFRKSAFECERLERKYKKWEFWNALKSCSDVFSKTEMKKRWRDYPFGLIHSLYRTLSFYGESWSFAFFWLVLIWLGFAFLFLGFSRFSRRKDYKFLAFVRIQLASNDSAKARTETCRIVDNVFIWLGNNSRPNPNRFARFGNPPKIYPLNFLTFKT